MTHVTQVLNPLASAIGAQGAAIEWCGVDSTGTALVRATCRAGGRQVRIGWHSLACTWSVQADRWSHSARLWVWTAGINMIGLTAWAEVARVAAQYLRTGRLTLSEMSEEAVEARRQERRLKREREEAEYRAARGALAEELMRRTFTFKLSHGAKQGVREAYSLRGEEHVAVELCPTRDYEPSARVKVRPVGRYFLTSGRDLHIVLEVEEVEP